MKTPEEIKQGLRCCSMVAETLDRAECENICSMCPYSDRKICMIGLCNDALIYTSQLSGQLLRVGKMIDPTIHAPKWISVDNPPKAWQEEDGTLINFLIYTPENDIDIGNYVPQAKIWICMGYPTKITHWMPLPKPPKGGSTDD